MQVESIDLVTLTNMKIYEDYMHISSKLSSACINAAMHSSASCHRAFVSELRGRERQREGESDRERGHARTRAFNPVVNQLG